MCYKLVAIDCDNTLIDSNGKIPEENIKTIKYLSSKGVKFLIATGRNDVLVKDYLDQLGIKTPVIGCNGASIRDIYTDKIYYLSSFPSYKAKTVIDYCNKNDVPFRAFTLKRGFSNDSGINSKLSPHVIETYIKSMENLKDMDYDKLIECVKKDEILKIVISNDDMHSIVRIQNDLNMIIELEIVRSSRECLDIINKGVSKGAALKMFAELNSIKQEEVIAIGDNENDASMITYAGLGIAMENGDESLKQISNLIADTNNNAGVGKVLKQIFKISPSFVL